MNLFTTPLRSEFATTMPVGPARSAGGRHVPAGVHLVRQAFALLVCVGAGFMPSEACAEASSAQSQEAPVAPLQTEFVYEAVVAIDNSVEVGATPLGRRRYIPITGGSFAGPRLRGSVLPGGADWQTERTDGVTEADALYSIRADDGTVIIVRNQGVIAPGGYMRTALRFTAPEGPHAWLNQSQFVSSIAGGPRPGTVIIRVFRVL